MLYNITLQTFDCSFDDVKKYYKNHLDGCVKSEILLICGNPGKYNEMQCNVNQGSLLLDSRFGLEIKLIKTFFFSLIRDDLVRNNN